MMWLRLLARFRNRQGPASPARARRPHRLRLEALEDRLVPATTLVVDQTAGPYFTIQSAVNAASPGDTVKVDAGTYHEQVTVNKNNLRVLAKDGSACCSDVVIAPPATPVANTANGNAALVEIPAQGVTLKGFTVDGQGNIGIAYGVTIDGSGSGSILNNHITNIQGPASAQLGFGVYANTSAQVKILGDAIDHYNKGGILVKGGADAKIENNVVTGAGPVGTIAQNGIQIGDTPDLQVSKARVDNNIVSGNSYTNTANDGFVAIGILVFNQTNKVTVDHNWIYSNQEGIFTEATANAQISHNFAYGNSLDGIALFDTSSSNVTDNLSVNNGGNGIEVNGLGSGTANTAQHNNLQFNYAIGNGGNGILLDNAWNNTVSNNAAIVNVEYGINVSDGSSGNTIANNIAIGNGQGNILVQGNNHYSNDYSNGCGYGSVYNDLENSASCSGGSLAEV
jgi:parallel beta-helix repeat protein